MQRLLIKVLLIVTLTVASTLGRADETAEAEAQRQALFRAEMERIVEALNETWYDPFLRALDQQDLLERIFGLRLIDPAVKKNFIDRLEWTWDELIIAQFRETDDGVRAILLGVESRGNRGRAVVRFDLPKQQFNYHEYDLLLDDKNGLVIVDWIDYLDGMAFSRNIGEWLVAAMPRQPALRKLLDFRNPRENELFQFGELLKAARDNKLDRFMEIHDQLPERFQRQRVVVEARVQLARTVRKRREMLAGLERMAELFPEEPLYSLMLLDHYFPRRKYEEATNALLRLYRKLGFDDAAMEARLSAAALVQGDTADATARAERARELEQGLELGWWSTLNVRAALGDHAACVEALEVLENEFGYELRPDTLGRNEAYEALVASAEYKAWNADKTSSKQEW